jgi:hypothetical protein
MSKFLLIALTLSLALWGCSTKSPVQSPPGAGLPQGVVTIYPGQGFRFADAKVVNDSTGGSSDVLVYVPSNPAQVFLGDSTGDVVDLGVVPLESVTTAPDSGFTRGILQAVKYHAYCVRDQGGKYAKLYLNDVMRQYPSGSVTFQWVYQPSGAKTF